nr:hypothetical protein [uncultured Desulfobacter sp.]
MKRILFFRKFLFTLLLILTPGVIMAPAGHAEITASGDIDPSDYSSWTRFTDPYIGYSESGTLTINGTSSLTVDEMTIVMHQTLSEL